MRILIRKILLTAVAFPPLLATPQASAPGKLNPRPTSTPTPTPTPKPPLTVAPAANQPKTAPGAPNTTPPGPVVARPTPGAPSTTAPGAVAARPAPVTPAPPLSGVAPAFGTGTPDHSPDQLDFGEVWDGDLARKTFHLTTNAAGYVTVQLPPGPFRVAEFREMGAIQQGVSKNAGNKPQPLAPVQPVKSKITYLDGQSGPFQWSLAPGADIQIDIAFQPHFKFGSEMAGLKSTTMKVTGPGPKLNWALSVPLRGMFDGLKLSATIVPKTKEIYAIAGSQQTPIDLSLFGIDSPVTGTVRAGSQMPHGVSVRPAKVTVGAKAKTPVSIWLDLSDFPADRVPRPLELVFDDGQKLSKTLMQFIGLPDSLNLSSGERHDCGVAGAVLNLQITLSPSDGKSLPSGGVTYQFRGWNVDLADRRTIFMAAESNGIGLFDSKFTLLERSFGDTKVSTTRRFTAYPDTWAKILDGPARFGCYLADQSSQPKPENLKWAPAAP